MQGGSVAEGSESRVERRLEMDKSPGMSPSSSRKWLWIGLGAVVLIALVVLLISQTGGGSGGGIY